MNEKISSFYEDLDTALKIRSIIKLLDFANGYTDLADFAAGSPERTIIHNLIGNYLSNLSGGIVDTAVALVNDGPLFAGEIPSKSGRASLLKLELAHQIVVKGEDGFSAGNTTLVALCEDNQWVRAKSHRVAYAEIEQEDFDQAMSMICKILNDAIVKASPGNKVWFEPAILLAYMTEQMKETDDRIEIWEQRDND